MSCNNFKPHVHVIPEDDANRQVANGFVLNLGRQIQVLPEAGGWKAALQQFQKDQVSEMLRYENRFVVLLIDFDEDQKRLEFVTNEIPGELKDRVFVLGTWSEPERLKPELGSFETIGASLAEACRDNTDATWAHKLLKHNSDELERLRNTVRPFLFS